MLKARLYRGILLLSFLTALGLSSVAFAGGGAPAVSSGNEYVELKPILLPIIDGNGVSQIVNIIVALEVETLSMADKAKRMQPKLTDAFIQDMYGVLAEQAATNGGMLHIADIKKRLLKVSNNILADGDKRVQDVLLQMVDQRRI